MSIPNAPMCTCDLEPDFRYEPNCGYSANSGDGEHPFAVLDAEQAVLCVCETEANANLIAQALNRAVTRGFNTLCLVHPYGQSSD